MEEKIASLETLIGEVNRPLWKAAALARLEEIQAENAKLRMCLDMANAQIERPLPVVHEKEALVLQVEGMRKIVDAAIAWRKDAHPDREGDLAVAVDTLTGGPLALKREGDKPWRCRCGNEDCG